MFDLMAELIRPLTLQGSCLPFSNQDHGFGSTALQNRGTNAHSCSLDVWGELGKDYGVLRGAPWHFLSPLPDFGFLIRLSFKKLEGSSDPSSDFGTGETEAK